MNRGESMHWLILLGVVALFGGVGPGLAIAQTTSEIMFAATPAAVSNLNVNCGPESAPEVGVYYQLTCVAFGGTPPYRWAVSAGTLPTGTTFSVLQGGSRVFVVGTLTTTGVFSYTVQVTDSAMPNAQSVFVPQQVTIYPHLSFSCSSVDTAEVGLPYSAQEAGVCLPILMSSACMPFRGFCRQWMGIR